MSRMSVPDIRSWETPATAYECDESGNFRLNHYRKVIGKNKSYAMNLMYINLRPITITRLVEYRDGEWHYWMTDNPIDYWSMVQYAEKAHGKVLVGGLGLALLPQELAKNESVTDVTIVEINPDVINLTGKYVPDNMKLINDDLWVFTEKDNTDWDYIIVDIWATETKEEHEQLFKDEVKGKYDYLRKKYPNSSITIHGFPMVSDIQVRI